MISALVKRYWLQLLAAMAVVVLFVLLAITRADLRVAASDNAVLKSDNNLQGLAIASQAFNFSRFNQAAEQAGRLNSLIDAGTDKTVIEYREILRREKTCDLPVPADVAGGLLDYANSLRASAMHAAPGVADATNGSAVAASRLTYCQAVLWIKPLLAAIEKGNNQLAGIRQIEQERK